VSCPWPPPAAGGVASGMSVPGESAHTSSRQFPFFLGTTAERPIAPPRDGLASPAPGATSV
jgi:hypothetical protein